LAEAQCGFLRYGFKKCSGLNYAAFDRNFSLAFPNGNVLPAQQVEVGVEEGMDVRLPKYFSVSVLLGFGGAKKRTRAAMVVSCRCLNA
jgi:hypothetical protein